MLRALVLVCFSLTISFIEVGIAEQKGSGPQSSFTSTLLTNVSGSPWKKPELDIYPCDPTKPDACDENSECVLHEAKCSLSGKNCTIDQDYHEKGCDNPIQCGACRPITPADKITAGTCDYSFCETLPHFAPNTCSTSLDCEACWNRKINDWQQAPCKTRASEPGVGVCNGCPGIEGLCDLNDPTASCKPDAYLNGSTTPVFYDQCLASYRCKKTSKSPPSEMCGYYLDVAGLVKQCCCSLKPYNVVSCNCTDFANEFHNLCIQQGINCKTLHVFCKGKAHAMNVVQINENQCVLVEPQGGKNGGIIGRFDCEKGPRPDQICAAVEEKSPCECKIELSDQPVPPNTDDAGMCSRTADKGKSPQQHKLRTCEKCCQDTAAVFSGSVGKEDWLNACIWECLKKYGPNNGQFAAIPSQKK